jgi:hypothetical protein
MDEILAVILADNARTRVLKRDGSYERVQPGAGEPVVRAQSRFIEIAKAQATVPLVDKGLRIRPTMRLQPRVSDLPERGTGTRLPPPRQTVLTPAPVVGHAPQVVRTSAPSSPPAPPHSPAPPGAKDALPLPGVAPPPGSAPV